MKKFYFYIINIAITVFLTIIMIISAKQGDLNNNIGFGFSMCVLIIEGVLGWVVVGFSLGVKWEETDITNKIELVSAGLVYQREVIVTDYEAVRKFMDGGNVKRKVGIGVYGTETTLRYEVEKQ
mgnify:CR=1 FL=1